MRDPHERQYFHEHIEPRLNHRVKFIKEPGRPRIMKLLGDAVALVNPIRWNEPFGMVMIEAQACGTPVLAFDWGAAPELVEHGATGFISSSVEQMVADVGRVGTISRAHVRAHVEQWFGADRMVEQHLALYEAVANHRGSSRSALVEVDGETEQRPARTGVTPCSPGSPTVTLRDARRIQVASGLPVVFLGVGRAVEPLKVRPSGEARAARRVVNVHEKEGIRGVRADVTDVGRTCGGPAEPVSREQRSALPQRGRGGPSLAGRVAERGRLRRRGEAIDDLVQVAAIGVLQAAERFEPDRGAMFRTFAAVTADGELRRYYRSSWRMRVPRGVQELSLQLDEASERLTMARGRFPSLADVADALHRPLRDVEEAFLAGQSFRPASLDQRVGMYGDVHLCAEDGDDERTVDRVQLAALIAGLPERQRQVLHLRFTEGRNQRNIAALVGVTVHVRGCSGRRWIGSARPLSLRRAAAPEHCCSVRSSWCCCSSATAKPRPIAAVCISATPTSS